MGQGQEESARKMITEGILNGHWLMLQNCHLSLEFCDEIMQTMLDTDEMHPNFRPGFFRENIFKQCSGSMTCWCGYGSGSADPCL
jgi:hypothetical protein